MTILHIALHYLNEKQADIFFGKVLGFKTEKEFIVPADFSKIIFGIKGKIKVKFYSDNTNNKILFEVFITDIKPKTVFEHVCLLVNDKKDLIEKCKKYGVKILNTRRNNKEYLFIRDFPGYLYEIKEIKKYKQRGKNDV